MVEFDKIKNTETSLTEKLAFEYFFNNLLINKLDKLKSSPNITYAIRQQIQDKLTEYLLDIKVCDRLSDQIRFTIMNNGKIKVIFSSSYYLDISLETFANACEEIMPYLWFPHLEMVVTDLEVSNRVVSLFKPIFIRFSDIINNFSHETFDLFFDQCEKEKCLIPLDTSIDSCKKIISLLDRTKYTIENDTLHRVGVVYYGV